MKRHITAIIFTAAALTTFAASPADVIDDLREMPGTEYVHIPRFLMWCGKKIGGVASEPMVRNLKSITVVTSSDVSAKVADSYFERFGNFKGYQTVMSANSDGSRVKIIAGVKGNNYKDFYILTGDSCNLSLVKLAGKFSSDELTALIEKQLDE